jgi:sugar/nucleoside kinase (ribokinase family)
MPDRRPVIGSAGELLVEFVATDRNGRHRRATHYAGPFPSGAPGILIDQAAKVGAAALFAGAVGEDAFGAVLLDRFAADGVSTELIEIVPGVPTGSAFVSYNDDGSRDFVFNIAHSAAARLGEPQAIAARLIAAGTDIFHVSGSTLGDPGMAATLTALCEALDDAGVALSFDPNVRKELAGDPGYRRAVDRLTASCRYFLPSEEDLAVLFPGDDFAAMAGRLLGGRAEYVVLKRGDKGALGMSGSGELLDMPAFPAAVLDPTGAGDCFCATLVTLLGSGMGFAEALSHANAAGALAVGRVGPMEGNSTLDEIEALLNGGGR